MLSQVSTRTILVGEPISNYMRFQQLAWERVTLFDVPLVLAYESTREVGRTENESSGK